MLKYFHSNRQISSLPRNGQTFVDQTFLFKFEKPCFIRIGTDSLVTWTPASPGRTVRPISSAARSTGGSPDKKWMKDIRSQFDQVKISTHFMSTFFIHPTFWYLKFGLHCKHWHVSTAVCKLRRLAHCKLLQFI